MQKLNKNTRKAEGITMMALVVSVIMILILAGVSLNFTIRREWNTEDIITSSNRE